MINLSEILPQLFIGSQPRSDIDVGVLKRAGVNAVLNLQTDQDFVDWGVPWDRLRVCYEQHDIVVQRSPILDFDPTDLRARLAGAVESLDQLVTDHSRTYVHCTAGFGRAPAVTIAYLAWYRDFSLEQAYTHVTECRSCAPSMEAIRLADADRLQQVQNG